MSSDVADPAEAVAVAPAADAGFLQRHGTSIEYILIPGAALVGALVRGRGRTTDRDVAGR